VVYNKKTGAAHRNLEKEDFQTRRDEAAR
jgi:hypothetical protein